MNIALTARWASIALACAVFLAAEGETKIKPKILIFSKTAGYRHQSISAGISALRQLCVELDIETDTTENAEKFTAENLKQYQAVVFLSTTGDVLNDKQQKVFEDFIRAGGGFVGIHAATDTEYAWPWYNQLVGAYFESHPNDPNVRQGEFITVNKGHPASKFLPDRFTRTDEFYNFKNIKSNINVLVEIDERSYEGGTHGARHPMSWYHEFDGGRAFYTAMGHTDESFSEPLFLKHLAGGLHYAINSIK